MGQEELRLLSKIQYPKDLRELKVDELPQVCEELRQDIVQELSVNPGHLASSLGVAEITVALHYVYNTPEDRIVWDVGHQAYGHKILTGRREQFCTIPIRERIRHLCLRSCLELYFSSAGYGCRRQIRRQ